MNPDGIPLVTGGSRRIGAATATLLSPASRGVTGIDLSVDAGFLAGSTWDANGGSREAPSR
jgi:hypothetical protein